MIHRCVCALPHDVIVRLLFGGTGRLDWSGRKENTFLNRDIPSKSVFPVRAAVKGPVAKLVKKFNFFSQNQSDEQSNSELVGQFGMFVSALSYYRP